MPITVLPNRRPQAATLNRSARATMRLWLRWRRGRRRRISGIVGAVRRVVLVVLVGRGVDVLDDDPGGLGVGGLRHRDGLALGALEQDLEGLQGVLLLPVVERRRPEPERGELVEGEPGAVAGVLAVLEEDDAELLEQLLEAGPARAGALALEGDGLADLPEESRDRLARRPAPAP